MSADEAGTLDPATMTEEQGLALVRRALAEELGIEPDTVTPETRFVEDLGLDSLEIVGILVGLQDDLGIEGDLEEVEEPVATVGDLWSLLKKFA